MGVGHGSGGGGGDGGGGGGGGGGKVGSVERVLEDEVFFSPLWGSGKKGGRSILDVFFLMSDGFFFSLFCSHEWQ